MIRNNFDRIIEQLKNNDPDLTTLELSGEVHTDPNSPDLPIAPNTIDGLLRRTDKIHHKATQNAIFINNLADALKNNRTLHTLVLKSFCLMNDGTKVLAEALKTNRTLLALNLSHNWINNTGVNALVAVLKINNTLLSLNLCNNSIDSIGAKYLARSLKVNETLNWLYLDHNNIANAGVKSLIDALKINQTLQILNLDFIKINRINCITEITDKITKELVSEINKSVEQNVQFREKYKKEQKQILSECNIIPELVDVIQGYTSLEFPHQKENNAKEAKKPVLTKRRHDSSPSIPSIKNAQNSFRSNLSLFSSSVQTANTSQAINQPLIQENPKRLRK
jgi:hypothetical protein